MNASLVLLLLFLSTCYGEEQVGFPASAISATTKWENEIEAPLEISCPDPTDIEPCECKNNVNLIMDCSKVLDEEQLRGVFSAVFPTTEFYSFQMDFNDGPKILEDGVFGNVSFQSLHLFKCAFETVQNDALTSSLSTLTHITIQYCQLSTFPFERLEEFGSLEILGLYSNKIHTLPPLSSSSLRFLSVSYNAIEHLSPDVFTLLQAAEQIYLNGNQLTEVPKGTFTGLPEIEYVDLAHNNVSYLQSLTFDLTSSPSKQMYLGLGDNNIDFVAEFAFNGVSGSANISMINNALTRLPEEEWRSVLEKGTNVKLSGNNLTCGCDVAWLVTDPQLLTKVADAHCADGTMLMDLNAADFDICE